MVIIIKKLLNIKNIIYKKWPMANEYTLIE